MSAFVLFGASTRCFACFLPVSHSNEDITVTWECLVLIAAVDKAISFQVDGFFCFIHHFPPFGEPKPLKNHLKTKLKHVL